jgi:CRP/FNR family cyclic AMP-dependent transcriptional regulator
VITLEKVLFLSNVPLFADMDARELSRVAVVAEEVVFPAGSLVFAEGDYGDSLYFIVEGTVRVHRGDATLATLGERSYFGEMAILDGEPRSASISCESDCLLLRIDQDSFLRILEQQPRAALAVIRALIQLIRRKEAKK